MNIQTKSFPSVLKSQPKEFVDMVTNAKEGDLFIYSYPSQIIFSYDALGNAESALFLVESVDSIGTRFGSRDRILRGWRCKPGKEDCTIVKVEKTSVWCSQLANTDKYNKEFTII